MVENLTKTIRDALEDEIGWCSYDCSRVWSAWGVGTMDDQDFSPVSDRMEEIVNNIVSAVLLVIANEQTKERTEDLISS